MPTVQNNCQRLHTIGEIGIASLDLRQAFDKVPPPLLGEGRKSFAVDPTLATTMLGE